MPPRICFREQIKARYKEIAQDRRPSFLVCPPGSGRDFWRRGTASGHPWLLTDHTPQCTLLFCVLRCCAVAHQSVTSFQCRPLPGYPGEGHHHLSSYTSGILGASLFSSSPKSTLSSEPIDSISSLSLKCHLSSFPLLPAPFAIFAFSFSLPLSEYPVDLIVLAVVDELAWIKYCNGVYQRVVLVLSHSLAAIFYENFPHPHFFWFPLKITVDSWILKHVL